MIDICYHIMSLPQEMINKILYEHKGLQTPSAKAMKTLIENPMTMKTVATIPIRKVCDSGFDYPRERYLHLTLCKMNISKRSFNTEQEPNKDSMIDYALSYRCMQWKKGKRGIVDIVRARTKLISGILNDHLNFEGGSPPPHLVRELADAIFI